MPVPGCFCYCGSIIQVDIRDADASRSSFIVQDCFGILVFWFFSYEIEYYFFQVSKELCWDFDRDCIDFGRIAIFILLILPIQEHRKFFHFLLSSSFLSSKT